MTSFSIINRNLSKPKPHEFASAIMKEFHSLNQRFEDGFDLMHLSCAMRVVSSRAKSIHDAHVFFEGRYEVEESDSYGAIFGVTGDHMIDERSVTFCWDLDIAHFEAVIVDIEAEYGLAEIISRETVIDMVGADRVKTWEYNHAQK